MADEQPKPEEKTAIVQKVTEPEAFQTYLEMGVDRSIEKVQEVFRERSVSLRWLYEWSSRNHWVEKADNHDKEVHDALMRVALKKVVRSKIDILTICQAVFGQFAVELKGEEIIIKRKDKDGNEIKEVKIRRYHPDMSDVERAYRIIKEEIGEGLPDFSQLREVNFIKNEFNLYKILIDLDDSTRQRINKRLLELADEQGRNVGNSLPNRPSSDDRKGDLPAEGKN